ncbi:RICIN domain-containing protein [Micromonospora craterilacus]|uniref:RICIN domain-containing protein n=1 Tax=Micromonospora craterilacus TaxID=1655439 RepID=UPI001314B792|nr:RICIN domain-containing protein [Micromonospora craterilacus]
MGGKSGEDNWEQAAEWERVAHENQEEPARGDWILGRPDPGGTSPDATPAEPAGPGPDTAPRRLLRAVPTKLVVAAGTLVVVTAAVGLSVASGSSDRPAATPPVEGALQDDLPQATGTTAGVDPQPEPSTVRVAPTEGDGIESDGGEADAPGRNGAVAPRGSARPGGGGSRTAEPREDRQPSGATESARPTPVASRVVEPTAAPAPAYTAPLPGVTVRLVSDATGKSAGVSGGSGTDGARVVQSGNADNSAQHWRVVTGRSGCYHLINVRTGKALDNTDGTSVNGMQMQQWTYHDGAPNQIWCFTGLGGNRYSIKNMTSGFLLDIRDGRTADGVAVQQWNADPANPNVNQTWRLIQVS